MPDVKQAHLQTAKCHPANQSLQKSLLCQPAKKNKKSSLSLKNKTLQTHNQPDNNGMTEQTVNIKGMSIEKKEGQLVTRGIKHWGLSGYSSVLPRIKFGVTRQESSPQSPTISYRHPLVASIANHTKTTGTLKTE